MKMIEKTASNLEDRLKNTYFEQRERKIYIFKTNPQELCGKIIKYLICFIGIQAGKERVWYRKKFLRK